MKSPCSNNPKWSMSHCNIYLHPYFSMDKDKQADHPLACKQTECKVFKMLQEIQDKKVLVAVTA